MLKFDKQRIGGMNVSSKGNSFSDSLIDEIIQGAYNILSEIGIRVKDDNIVGILKEKGFTQKNDRILIDATVSRAYFDKHQCRNQKKNIDVDSQNTDIAYDGWVNTWPLHYIDHISGKILKYDTASLSAISRFVNNYCEQEGITPGVPGYPSDVPPVLETLARYKIAIENCPAGIEEDPASFLSAKYMFEMAEVVGRKMEHTPIYMSTPLTLGGDTVKIAMEFRDRLKSVSVGSMPSFGASTPLTISGAFALVLAENLGGAILVNALTDLPAYFGASVIPFDFHSLNISYGSPEKLIFDLLSIEFNAKLRGGKPEVSSVCIHTWAKRPGAQAAFEKGSQITAGAMLGAKHFVGLGALSMDEIFCPIQLVLDVEMMHHVGRMVKGSAVEHMPENIVEMIQQNIDRSFLESDLTLDNHSDFIWYPKLFTRDSLSKWQHLKERDALDEANQIVSKLWHAEPKYELDKEQKKEIDSIYSKACAEVYPISVPE